jgi:hypothetical protein
MDEWDVVQGIFHKHLNYGENIPKALKLETSGHWDNALREYEAALHSMDDQDNLNDYCYEALYKVCF